MTTNNKTHNVTVFLPTQEYKIRLDVIRKRLGLRSYSQTVLRMIDLVYEGKVGDEGKDPVVG